MNNLRKYTNFTRAELDKKSGVYIILNTLSNSAYIGESSNLYRRLNEHLLMLLNNSHYNNHLQNSFNKHGITNFKFKILEFCSNTKEKEHQYVTEFKNNMTFSTILNIKPTDPVAINLRSKETSDKIYLTKKKKADERGYWHSPESIMRRRITRKGYTHSEETRKKIGITSLGRRMPARTEEFKKFMSTLSKDKKLGGRNKRKIIQLSKTDEYIRTWDSISEASLYINSSTGAICDVLANRRKTCKGYKWKYETM